MNSPDNFAEALRYPEIPTEENLERWHRNVTRMANLAKKAGNLLTRNDGDPQTWPDPEKLRLMALHFEAEDLGLPSPLVEPGTEDSEMIQDDLFRMASRMELTDVPSSTEQVASIVKGHIRAKVGITIAQKTIEDALRLAGLA